MKVLIADQDLVTRLLPMERELAIDVMRARSNTCLER